MTEPMDCRHGHRIKFGERAVNVRGETGDLPHRLYQAQSARCQLCRDVYPVFGRGRQASMPCTMRA